MKHLGIIVFGITPLVAWSQPAEVVLPETEPSAVRQYGPQVWLGVDLFKADPSIRVHLPSMPEGIGFVVRVLHKDGPADRAGLLEYDVLWKMDDQLLVNQAQLATLLRLHKPGDKVKIHGFRAGKHIEMDLTLEPAPKGRLSFPSSMVDEAMLQDQLGGPMRVVNIAEKTASYSTSEGSARVWREGDAYHVRIDAPDGALIFEGALDRKGVPKGLPRTWTQRVMALRRGLDHALTGGGYSVRQPRPRVVPPTDSSSGNR